MLLTRFRSLMLVLGLLGGSSAALAQQGGIKQGNLPFPPANISDEHDYQLFAPANLSEYGNGPQAKEGFFARYDRLSWAVSGPKTSTIGNDSAESFTNVGAFPILDVNSLDNSFIQAGNTWGNRYEIGYMKNDRGWMVGAFKLHTHDKSIRQTPGSIAFNDPLGVTRRFIDLNGDGIDDDLNVNMIFGNTSPFNQDLLGPILNSTGQATGIFGVIGSPYVIFAPGPPPVGAPAIVFADGILDSYVGADFGDAVLFPITFTNLFANNQTEVNGVELMHLIRWDPLHSGGNVEWLVGLRYTNVKDIFSLLGTNETGTIRQFSLTNQINNYMIGPQVGVRWNLDQGRWQLNTEARLAATANFQDANLRSAFNGAFITANADANALTAANFSSYLDQESSLQFSPIGELRLDVGYKITERLSLRVGYTGTLIGGITRASRRVTYDFPGVFPDGTTTTGIQINDENRLESFYMSGVNFGIEWNR